MKLPPIFHALRYGQYALDSVDQTEEEFQFLLHCVWFIESITNQNYNVELQSLLISDEGCNKTFRLECSFPKGRVSSTPDLDFKVFEGEIITTEFETLCHLCNQSLLDEVMQVQLIKPIDTNLASLQLNVHYLDTVGSIFSYKTRINKRPTLIAQPFLELLVKLEALDNISI